MKSNLHARIAKLETARRLNLPATAFIVMGTEEEVEQQVEAAIADGRYQRGGPLVQILLVAPRLDSAGKPLPPVGPID